MLPLRIVLCLTFAVVANLLSGCASAPEAEPKPELQQVANSLSALTPAQRDELLVMLRKHKYNDELIQQWQQSQPGVARLLAIESDLKMLIGQLNNLANEEPVTGNQAKNTDPTPEKPKTELTPTVKMGSLKPESKANDQLFGFISIQLAAMSRFESIERSWQTAIEQNPSLVGNLIPVAEVVERSSGTIYRLKAGRFDNKDDAILLCNKLRKANVSCVASAYTAGAVYLPVN